MSLKVGSSGFSALFIVVRSLSEGPLAVLLSDRVLHLLYILKTTPTEHFLQLREPPKFSGGPGLDCSEAEVQF